MGCNESQIKAINNAPTIIQQTPKTISKALLRGNNLNGQQSQNKFYQSIIKQLDQPIYRVLLSSNYILQIIKQLKYSFVTVNQRDSIIQLVLDYLALSKNHVNNNTSLKTKLSMNSFINKLGQKWLKLKNQIYFNNSDALKILTFIKSTTNGKTLGFLSLKFEFETQEVKNIAKSVKQLCIFDLRAFSFLSNYLYKCCINMEKKGNSLQLIEEQLLKILQMIAREHPPAPPLEGDQQLFTRHESYKKQLEQEQKNYLDLSQFNAIDREKKLQQFIEERAKDASKYYNQFVDLIKDICTKQGYHFKSGLKLKDISQKRALQRVKQKMLNKSFHKFNIKGCSKDIKTINQYINAQQNSYEKKIHDMYQNLNEKIQFKVTDLLRAKCMFATIDKINECCEELKKQTTKRGYKIVQIDNRLRGKTGTSDIVLKILIKKTVAQLQLVIDLNVASYQFSHKIYEIIRSKFLTPITMLKVMNQKLSIDYFNELQKLIEKNIKSERKNKYRQQITYQQIQKQFQQFVKIIPVSLGEKNSLGSFSTYLYELQARFKIISSQPLKNKPTQQNNIIHKNNCEFKIALKEYDQALKQSNMFLQLQQKRFSQLLQQTKSQVPLTVQQRQQYINYANSIKNMGKIQENKGSNDKAIQYYELFISLIQLIDPNDSEYTISKMQFNIAWIQYKKSNYQKSLHYYHKILINQQKKLGKEHLQYASTLNNIGLVYYGQGNYPQSLKVYQQSLKIRQKILGKFSFQCTSTLNNIGLVYNSLGKYSESLMYFQRCLEIKEKFKGKQSTDCALTLNNIGMVCSNQGNLQQALKNYKRSLQIREAIKGLQNIDCATALNNIGLIYYRQGKFQNALNYINRSLSIRSQVNGKNSIDCSTNYLNIGQIYMKQRKFKDAIDFCQKARQIRQKIRGKNSVSYASVSISLGCIYLQEGRFQQALQNFNVAHQTILEIKGSKSKDLASCKKSIAYLYLKNEQLQKSQQFLKNALQIYNEDNEEQKLNTSQVYVYLGDIEFKRKNLDFSKQYYEKASKICQKANYLYQYWAQSRRGLANIHYHNNNFNAAINQYQKASSILAKFNQLSYTQNQLSLQQCKRKNQQ